ncbi:ArsR/SmtB family transcription factor [Streptomyces sp. NPDC059506]|uniref:Winged helix-turn-helix domain-containing protein n=1 Tax=Streptomyces thermolineatus TaxID=44033 RepID=A0ABP5ZCC6_9ACTN|nr:MULTISPECIES: helix-turn-helix domain-containing protein [unclassified Streptomyces]MCZ2527963.1 helix-turn-helix domain-containing protein [Streptomyces sp. HB2AG]PLW72505.1 transcriptional regulator [Streptomyces sp. DJ]QMV22017.1 helix-turn-helix domain-containing protein [Streptomyces sp. SCUT-3]
MPDEEGHPSREEMDLRCVMNALADPLRYQVVSALVKDAEDKERHCSSFGLPVSKSTRTHHFRILRQAGLIRQVDRGNSRMAHLRRADLDARFPGLLDLIRQNPAALPGSD